MKRKDFLQLSAYAGIAMVIPIVNACNGNPANMAIAESPFLMGFMDQKTIQGAGQDYIRQFPGESSKRKLEELLVSGSTITGSTPAESVHQYFNKKTLDDFDHHRTVVVDGWVLSQTEGRQCALFEKVHE